MISPTQTRVIENTPTEINERIRQESRDRIRHLADDPRGIDARISELEEEWDIERTLETNAAAVSLVGLGLATFVDRKWMALPTLVAAFLLQHALQGWCPPVPLFRRLGVRTAAEIERERVALKVLRGDFENIPRRHVGDVAARADAAWHAADPSV